MPFNLHLCEGWKLPNKCVFNCCQHKPATNDDVPPAGAKTAKPSGGGPSKADPPQVMMIQDLSLDLTVVSAPHRLLKTLGEDPPDDEPWDFMSVDKDRRLVMLAGKRFLGFASGHPEFAARADACRGQTIADVFPRGIVDIFGPLIDFSLSGEGGQLHSIFRGHSLTFFAYPLKNETQEVIGAHVVYRPTRYDASDIAALISTGARPATPVPAAPVTPVAAPADAQPLKI